MGPQTASVCRSCGARVRFVKTEAGRSMPLDPEPDDERGNVVMIRGQAKVYRDAAEARRRHEGDRYLAHFASCPSAGQHRRPPREARVGVACAGCGKGLPRDSRAVRPYPWRLCLACTVRDDEWLRPWEGAQADSRSHSTYTT